MDPAFNTENLRMSHYEAELGLFNTDWHMVDRGKGT